MSLITVFLVYGLGSHVSSIKITGLNLVIMGLVLFLFVFLVPFPKASLKRLLNASH